jgi:FkbM family methyltransferase
LNSQKKTLAIAHHLRPSGGSVLAFEPHPDNYLALRENIVRNGLDNVVAQEVGLAESPGSHTGAAPPGPGNWSVASEGPRRFKIDLIRFDDFARNTHLHRLDAAVGDVQVGDI